MNRIHSTMSCNLDANILKAAWPLLADGAVDALEWSFDALYNVDKIPEWFVELIQAFSDSGRLVGHGVYFSLFSGRWLPEQEKWLKELSKWSAEFTFDHISEHFGFMTGADFHKGAPVSIPYNKTTVNIGRDRLRRIFDVCQCPVGLENLAFAYSLDEVKKHGEFLSELISPINGFIILDLHNFYCHLHNFDVKWDDLIKLYPLDRVREIHISGGSWQSSSVNPERQVRRDTHDDGVPQEVFDLLKVVSPLCPNLKYVVLEQIGVSLASENSREQFREDFREMDKILKDEESDNKIKLNDFLPKNLPLNVEPCASELLFQEQQALTTILENAHDVADAQQRLQESILANSDWKTENWSPYMLETVVMIAQKWKHGFNR